MTSLAMNRVREMSLQGYTPAHISETLGLSRGTVAVYRSQMQVSAKAAAPRPIKAGVYVRLPEDVAEELTAEAAKRGMSPAVLARRLLTVVLDEDMVRAVLDE